MLEETIKCLGWYLIVTSYIGLLFLFKCKNQYRFFVLFAIVFSLLWRSLFSNNSSRYYIALLFYGILLSVYATNKLVYLFNSSKTKRLFISFLILIIFFDYTIESFLSFRNIYVFDVLESSQKILKNNCSVIFYDTKLKRLKTISSSFEGNASVCELQTGYEDLSELHFYYLTYPGDLYLILKQKQTILKSENNPFFLTNSKNILQSIGNHISNSKHSSSVSLYKLAQHSPEQNIIFNNTKYLTSPGIFTFSDNEIITSETVIPREDGIMIRGKQSRTYSAMKILLSNHALDTSVRIKNVGSCETSVSIGFELFTQYHTRLSPKNYPYRNINNILSVMSAEKGSDKIIVDSMPVWTKGCYIAIHAQEDLSDIPDPTILDGRVSEIKQLADNQVQITISTPLTNTIDKGTKIRIHGSSTNPMYCNTKKLQPGEEQVFLSKNEWNLNANEYLANTFPREAFYVVPILFSYSANPKEDNCILINDYILSY